MSEETKIAWCDSTWNPWQGCTKVSAGCAHCYAEARDKRFMRGVHWGKGAFRKRARVPDEPLKWNKKPWVCNICHAALADPYTLHGVCSASGDCHRRMVFSLSLGDWLDEEVPIEWLADMLDVIRRCPGLDFLLLTKRPENLRKRRAQVMELVGRRTPPECELEKWLCDWVEGTPDGGVRRQAGSTVPLNVWLGVSVEDQAAADERIPVLLTIPARVRFLSVEPMLGPVRIKDALRCDVPIHWVIFGGESGPGARPCNVEWIRDGVRQCREAGVACFVKQLGTNIRLPNPQFEDGEDWIMKLRDKKGGDFSEPEFPNDLRVREWPMNDPMLKREGKV